jgi:hypothetical protein
MSGFYSHEWRSKWQPPLTYYQLRAAKSAGEDWERWCEWAVGEGSFNGRAASGDAIREAIAGKKTDDQRVLDLVKKLDKAMTQLVELTQDADWIVIHTMIKDKTNAEEK